MGRVILIDINSLKHVIVGDSDIKNIIKFSMKLTLQDFKSKLKFMIRENCDVNVENCKNLSMKYSDKFWKEF